jgi:hypothetical protein
MTSPSYQDYVDNFTDAIKALEGRPCGSAFPAAFPEASVEPLPSRLATPRRPKRVWVVKQASGGEIRVLAERHSTCPRPDGTELRFYDGAGDHEARVATVRAGSWHWCIAEAALEPDTDEEAES